MAWEITPKEIIDAVISGKVDEPDFKERLEAAFRNICTKEPCLVLLCSPLNNELLPTWADRLRERVGDTSDKTDEELLSIADLVRKGFCN